MISYSLLQCIVLHFQGSGKTLAFGIPILSKILNLKAQEEGDAYVSIWVEIRYGRSPVGM